MRLKLSGGGRFKGSGVWCAGAQRNTVQRCGALVVFFASGTATGASAQGAELIAAAQQVSVAWLDSTYPNVPFEKWLAELGRVRASAIRWEVNDCGEGGDGREAPTCVEAILNLTADTTAHASLVVAGVDGSRSKPAIWDLSVGAGDSFTGFKKLREWAAHVRTHRR